MKPQKRRDVGKCVQNGFAGGEEHEDQPGLVTAIQTDPDGQELGANPERKEPEADPEGPAPAKDAPRRTVRTPEDVRAAGTEPGRKEEHQEAQMVRAKPASACRPKL